jgi:hypothetical protein
MQLTEIKQADAHARLPIVRHFYELRGGGAKRYLIFYNAVA